LKHSGIYRKGELSLDDVLRDVRSSSGFGEAGGIGVFIGVVRGRSSEGHKVTKLEVDSYEDKAESTLSAISSELATREGIVDLRIYHIIGEFAPGDDLVYVVVAGAHRKEVFHVLREAVERYKHEAPFFKKEHLTDKKTGERSTRWVEEFPPK
jgi:molybdopterin synthase catalytic subunit